MDTLIKYKVGDRVELLNNGGYGPGFNAGDRGVVTKVQGDDLVRVLVDGKDSDPFFYTENFDDPEVRLIRDEEEGETPPVTPDFFEDDTILYYSGDQSQKADAGKSNPVLLEVDMSQALTAVNAVLDYGVAKYGQRGGWRKVDIERYDPAARRHRRARDNGELHDAESGLPHLAHEVCNLLFMLQTYLEENPELDATKFNAPPQDHRVK